MYIERSCQYCRCPGEKADHVRRGEHRFIDSNLFEIQSRPALDIVRTVDNEARVNGGVEREHKLVVANEMPDCPAQKGQRGLLGVWVGEVQVPVAQGEEISNSTC